MKNHPDNVLLQCLEYGFPLVIDKQKFKSSDQVENHPSAKTFPKDVNIYLEKKIACKPMVGPCPIIVDLSWPRV